MSVQTITLSGYSAQTATGGLLQLGTRDSYGIEQLQINPGPEWAGLTITATFVTPNSSTRMVVPASGLIDVPPEATAQTLTMGSPGVIVFAGVSDGVQRISTNVYYTVANHVPVEGSNPQPTPSEWQQFVTQVQQSAAQAAQSATDADASAAAAAGSANAAAAELSKVQGAGQAALTAISNAQNSAVGEVQTAQSTATQAVEQAGQTATQQVQTAGTEQANAVNQAGDAKLQQIADVNALLPTPTEADVGKAVIVNPDGSGYELGTVSGGGDAYTKAESDARYAPIESAIKVSDSGTGLVSLSPTVAWGMQGMTLYGRSWQDGTPSVETEAPIQDAGQSGTVNVIIRRGNFLPLAEESKTIVYNGITLNYNAETGVFNFSGEATSDAWFSLYWVINAPSTNKDNGDLVGDKGLYLVIDTPLPTGVQISCSPSPNVPIQAGGTHCTLQAPIQRIYMLVNSGQSISYAFRIGIFATPDAKWEPYSDESQQLPVPTPNGLPGIPVDSGGDWADESGQQWVSDVVDLDAGTLTQYCGQIASYAGEEITTPYISSTGALTTGAQVVYVLQEPVTTPLDTATIAAYKALTTYQGITNVLAPDCGIEASALADPNQWVQQQIQAAITQAVSQAVTLTGGAQ